MTIDLPIHDRNGKINLTKLKCKLITNKFEFKLFLDKIQSITECS